MQTVDSLYYNYLVDFSSKTKLQRFRPTRNCKTKALFGTSLVLDYSDTNYFPLLRMRKMFIDGIKGELATFLEGPESVKHFRRNGCNYWDKWAGKDFKIDYGNAWLDGNQLNIIVDSLKNNPYSRRHLMTGWRPTKLENLTLPCCHYAYQWFVNPDKYLELIWTQRSVDIAIGMPSDIASAMLLNILMAQTVGLKPGKITFNFGDSHIYKDHYPKLKQLIKQFDTLEMKERRYFKLPTYCLNKKATIQNFKPAMFMIENYEPEPSISFNLHT